MKLGSLDNVEDSDPVSSSVFVRVDEPSGLKLPVSVGERELSGETEPVLSRVKVLVRLKEPEGVDMFVTVSD